MPLAEISIRDSDGLRTRSRRDEQHERNEIRRHSALQWSMPSWPAEVDAASL
jgi:hypothetical protein